MFILDLFSLFLVLFIAVKRVSKIKGQSNINHIFVHTLLV